MNYDAFISSWARTFQSFRCAASSSATRLSLTCTVLVARKAEEMTIRKPRNDLMITGHDRKSRDKISSVLIINSELVVGHIDLK